LQEWKTVHLACEDSTGQGSGVRDQGSGVRGQFCPGRPLGNHGAAGCV
jgi:hypothetical protein